MENKTKFKEKLSIVVPCYNEEKTVPIFYDEVMKVIKDQKNNILSDLTYEIIFVNDGSSDNTLENIMKTAEADSNVKYINFSRNFGKEAALFAGLNMSSGDYVAVMDVDLQDPPSLLPEMFNEIKKPSIDVVATRRVSRKGEPVIRSFFAKCFYKLINLTTKLELVDGARDYRLMTGQVVDAILEIKEYNRFSKGLFNWVGFNIEWIEYENVERMAGESSWSFWSLLKYSIEGFVAYTTLPLSISTFLGMLFSFVAFILIIFVVVRNLLYSDPVQGWTSTICIILLLGGIQLFSIGILGKYLEKTYLETKKRPIYIIKDTNIDEK